ncbi:MAG TPA: hypothetical protein EYN67_11500 [Flavobacteriales bacterium]|nr:hypothetical protein [Methylococcaceae bacterium]HHZ96152.1 hypothetical protein [Flavobacteriales bacterium]
MKAYNNSVVLRNDGLDPSSLKEDLNAGISKLVTVRVASLPTPGLGALASLFDINSVSIANPVTTDNNGNYNFKVADGDYDIITEEGTANEVIEPSVEISEAVTTDRVIPFNDLDNAINESNTNRMFNGAALNLKERTIGGGGGAMWDVVLASSVTTNTFNIVQCIGIASLALVLRVGYKTETRQWGENDGGTIAFTTAAIQAALDSSASVIVFNSEDSPTIDPLYVRQSYKALELNEWSPKSASTLGVTTWALINVLKTDSPDGYNRPEQWKPIVNVFIDGGVIDYAESPDLATTNFHMVQINLGVNCQVNNMKLLNNFISVADTTKGSAVIFRGECRNCSCDSNDITTMRGHGFGHTNRYITGNFTEAAGEFGTDTYATNAEIDGLLRPQSTRYTNNILNDVYGYAFDVHSFNGISTITDNNRIVDCGSFFKNQTGKTVATGNYIKNLKTLIDVTMPQNTYWTGWLSGFINGIVYPIDTSIIENNTFINCPFEFVINHPTQQGGNKWLSEDGFILSGRRGAFTQSQAGTSSIINDKFHESWSGGIYLEEIATAPESNGQIDISSNKFKVFNTQVGAAQARIINANGTEGLDVINNSYTEQNPASTAFLMFCTIENINNAKINQNTVIKAAGQACDLVRNSSAGMTKNMALGNIGIGCVIQGTFDINANNLLV